MRNFDYEAPSTIEEAVTILGEKSPYAVPIAGGTYLLERMKQNLVIPKVLVDIANIPELKGIELTDQGLHIGAMVTHSDIIASTLIKSQAPVISDASAQVGSIQTRNLGTIGGSLVSCVPSNDSPPALLVLDAKVQVAGPKGLREIPLEELFKSPHCSILAPDELVVTIIIPKLFLGRPASFQKIGRRAAMTLALVNAAASVHFDNDKNELIDSCIALGAVAPTPIRAHSAERFLRGKQVSEDLIIAAAQIAAEEAKPFDDFRASAQYRRELITVLTRRVLQDCLSQGLKQ